MTSTYNHLSPADVGLVDVGDVRYLVTQNGPDMISAQLRKGQAWEPSTLRLAQLALQSVVQPVVLDIGANLGAFSVPIGRWLLERKGMIFAFEPQRVVYYQLCGNLFANGLRHVMARHCAVGDGSVSSIDVPQLDPQTDPNLGALSLDPNVLKWQRGSALGSGVESVPCIKLDDAGLPHAHLLKIDVEGMELEVLKGARSYIEASGWPVLMFEVWPESITPYAQKRKELLDFVAQELGYTSAHVGDLCIAQRPGFERIEIKVDGNRVDVRSKPA